MYRHGGILRVVQISAALMGGIVTRPHLGGAGSEPAVESAAGAPSDSQAASR